MKTYIQIDGYEFETDFVPAVGDRFQVDSRAYRITGRNVSVEFKPCGPYLHGARVHDRVVVVVVLLFEEIS